jgi:hypothetical protein
VRGYIFRFKRLPSRYDHRPRRIKLIHYPTLDQLQMKRTLVFGMAKFKLLNIGFRILDLDSGALQTGFLLCSVGKPTPRCAKSRFC